MTIVKRAALSTRRPGETGGEPVELVPGVWFSRAPDDRWLQIGNQRLQVPMRIGVYNHEDRLVRFIYPGVHKTYARTVVNSPYVLVVLKEFIDTILEQDELYEHWISMESLHRVAHEGEPHFLRIHAKRVGAYTGGYGQSIHFPYRGEGHSPRAMDTARRLALSYREDILAKRWEQSPDIVTIQGANHPVMGDKAVAGTRRPALRRTKRYKNPHTGVVVLTRGGNHATLRDWRKQWGLEAVDGWWSYEE